MRTAHSMVSPAGALRIRCIFIFCSHSVARCVCIWQNRIAFDSGCPTWDRKKNSLEWKQMHTHPTLWQIRSICTSSAHKHRHTHAPRAHETCFAIPYMKVLYRFHCLKKSWIRCTAERQNTPGSLAWISSILISLHVDVDLEDMVSLCMFLSFWNWTISSLVFSEKCYIFFFVFENDRPKNAFVVDFINFCTEYITQYHQLINLWNVPSGKYLFFFEKIRFNSRHLVIARCMCSLSSTVRLSTDIE